MNQMDSKINIFWFRRDLRLQDNAGLYFALKSGLSIIPLFIFDRNILDDLKCKSDRRLSFIYHSLETLQNELADLGSSLKIYNAKPIDAFKDIITHFVIQTVFANDDYEPYARMRDEEISVFLKQNSIQLKTFKDHVIFEKDEVLKNDGKPYTVFTPYSKKWKEKLNDSYLNPYPNEKYFHQFSKQTVIPLSTLKSIGFEPVIEKFPEKDFPIPIIQDYDERRNSPGKQGTSLLGVHLRFGTISIRKLVKTARQLNQTFLNELIWREFFQMILWHFPNVVSHSFKPQYEAVQWRNNEGEFQIWRNGQTGYPIVDAGMRELNQTGFMHNRVRMIVSSFLTKLLLIDWRWGEAYFAEKLLDYELASNNGNWQWAAGCGCDAAPYFRIFNPYTQAKKFDPDQKYIKKWIPELGTATYPKPMVDYKAARQRALGVYAAALKER